MNEIFLWRHPWTQFPWFWLFKAVTHERKLVFFRKVSDESLKELKTWTSTWEFRQVHIITWSWQLHWVEAINPKIYHLRLKSRFNTKFVERDKNFCAKKFLFYSFILRTTKLYVWASVTHLGYFIAANTYDYKILCVKRLTFHSNLFDY